MAGKPTNSVDVAWEGGFRFTANDAFGHNVSVDAPRRDADSYDGLKPGDMLLSSLAGCSGIDLVGILRKQRQQVTGLEIKVKGTQQPDAPWAYEEIELEYIVRGKGLKASAVEQAIHLSETKYCSVGATLSGTARITSTFTIVEEGDGPPGQ